MHGSLALKLRVLRAERALTIEQAAARAGVTPETISDAERGRRRPYLPTLRKLADAYEVPVEELLQAEEEAPKVPALPSPDEWAREHSARLHGMTDEEWIDHVRTLESVEELAVEWRALQQEAGMLRDLLRLDKLQRPADREQRIELTRAVRELRAHRYGDLAVEARLREAGELAERLWEAIQEEIQEEATL